MEKRKNDRLPVRPMEEPQGGGGAIPYRVLNISKAGCAIESVRLLPNAQSDMKFDLPLPGKSDRLRLSARIIWQGLTSRGETQVGYLYGLHFTEINTGSELILDLYLNYLRREVHLARLDEAWRKLRLAQERISVLIACEEKKGAHYLH